jgi:hypothetical protein
MNKDEEQLNLLSIYHYVVGGVMAFFACFPLIHVALGIAMLSGALENAKNPPPSGVGWLFVLLGGFFILIGWTMAVCAIAAGRQLKRRRAHTFCFVVACIECLFMPFGTVLGVFSIIVLQRDSVKQLFAANGS